MRYKTIKQGPRHVETIDESTRKALNYDIICQITNISTIESKLNNDYSLDNDQAKKIVAIRVIHKELLRNKNFMLHDLPESIALNMNLADFYAVAKMLNSDLNNVTLEDFENLVNTGAINTSLKGKHFNYVEYGIYKLNQTSHNEKQISIKTYNNQDQNNQHEISVSGSDTELLACEQEFLL